MQAIYIDIYLHLALGMTVPAFLDNVLNRHLDEHGDVLDEMVRTGTRNSR